MTDRELYGLFKSGDELAVQAATGKLRRYCGALYRNICGGEGEDGCARAAAQRALEALPDEPPESFSAYILSLAREYARQRAGEESPAAAIVSELRAACPEREGLAEAAEDELCSETESFLESVDYELRALFIQRYYLCVNLDKLCSMHRLSRRRVEALLEALLPRLCERLEKAGLRCSPESLFACLDGLGGGMVAAATGYRAPAARGLLNKKTAVAAAAAALVIALALIIPPLARGGGENAASAASPSEINAQYGCAYLSFGDEIADGLQAQGQADFEERGGEISAVRYTLSGKSPRADSFEMEYTAEKGSGASENSVNGANAEILEVNGVSIYYTDYEVMLGTRYSYGGEAYFDYGGCTYELTLNTSAPDRGEHYQRGDFADMLREIGKGFAQ